MSGGGLVESNAPSAVCSTILLMSEALVVAVRSSRIWSLRSAPYSDSRAHHSCDCFDDSVQEIQGVRAVINEIDTLSWNRGQTEENSRPCRVEQYCRPLDTVRLGYHQV